MVTPSKSVKNLVGQRFAKLVVLGYSHSNRHQLAVWDCQCDCGKTTKVMTQHLRSGKTKSCGCFHKEAMAARRQPDTYFKRVLRVAKSNAANRGYTFELSAEQYKALVLQSCHYCGREPTEKRFSFRHEEGAFPCHGVDRRDNSQGYTPENSVPCCAACNFAKMDFSEAEFLHTIELIYRNRIERK